jgi:hypothetical protein
MQFRILMAVLLGAGLLIWSPAYKSVAQDKKGTCEFGADDQKLKGAERKKFMARCMAKEDAPAPKKKPKKKAEKKTEG